MSAVLAHVRLPRRSLLDLATLILPIWLALIVTHTAADADLWGHLQFGSDLLAGRGLPSADPYSFTADIPWINHEWLSETAVAAAFAAAGAVGLNALKLAVIAALAAIVWRAARRAGASSTVAVTVTALVLLASYTRTQVLRPQLFSVLLFALLIAWLQRRERGGRAPWVAVPMLFCVWANAHGAWIVGCATLGVWLAVDVVTRRSMAAAASCALLLTSALAATLINPYGIHHWAFLGATVGLSRADITDWTPFLRLPAPIIALNLLLPALAVVSLAVCRRLPTPRQAAVAGVLAFATYRIGRVDAFLQIAIGLLFAPAIVETLGRLERWLRTRPRLSTPSPVHGAVCAAAIVVTAVAVTPRLGRVHIEGSWIPDAEAIGFLRAEAANARLLTWFDWGEYAIWHLSPEGIRVSMDGRRETVYSDRVLRDHWAFYGNAAGGWTYPDTIGATRIWLPRNLPMVATLREHGWRAVFESRVSVVLSRDPAEPRIVLAGHEPRAFFPGP